MTRNPDTPMAFYSTTTAVKWEPVAKEDPDDEQQVERDDVNEYACPG